MEVDVPANRYDEQGEDDSNQMYGDEDDDEDGEEGEIDEDYEEDPPNKRVRVR